MTSPMNDSLGYGMSSEEVRPVQRSQIAAAAWVAKRIKHETRRGTTIWKFAAHQVRSAAHE